MNIESLYQEFYQKNVQGNKYIDFIGINISFETEMPYIFKTYQHIGTTIIQSDPFLALLEKKDMIKNYLPIVSSDKNRVQYDVRMSNRHDNNMCEVISFLSSYLASSDLLSGKHIADMHYFSKMNITELPHHTMSALYFLGLMWKSGSLSALKTHFLTRKVNNPDHFSDGFWYDDKYFLEYIYASQNPLCQKIVDITTYILDNVEGHLWMFGIDIFKGKHQKYKLYLQNQKGFNLGELLQLLNQNYDLVDISKASKEFIPWLDNHPELLLYGFATTVTSSGSIGFNLYFIPPTLQKGTT